ncbi:MAG: hypothetical protein PHG66_06390 [Candidatus Colwellbacteria bacterium]|nr:hypothetical protein [Candidatus Colwellbacteria bacterium]
MFKCQFCDKELSTKQNLKIHQTKTKYCLDKQPLSTQLHQDEDKNECKYCGKTHFNNSRKIKHEAECPIKISNQKYEEEIRILKQNYETIIADLNAVVKKEKGEKEIYIDLYNKDQQFILDQSKRLAEKSGTTTTNNTIKAKNITMNSLNLSQERLESIKDTYTIKHYERGGVGQADWVVENVIKDAGGNLIYRCTDKNRRNFIYNDDKGNIITDIEAKKLKEALLPIMNTKLREFKKTKFSELAEEDDDDNSKLDKVNDLYIENKELGVKFDKRLVEKTYQN